MNFDFRNSAFVGGTLGFGSCAIPETMLSMGEKLLSGVVIALVTGLVHGAAKTLWARFMQKKASK